LSIAQLLEKKRADLVSLSERIDTTTASGRVVFRMLAVPIFAGKRKKPLKVRAGSGDADLVADEPHDDRNCDPGLYEGHSTMAPD
jgi:hypothetical protein